MLKINMYLNPSRPLLSVKIMITSARKNFKELRWLSSHKLFAAVNALNNGSSLKLYVWLQEGVTEMDHRVI